MEPVLTSSLYADFCNLFEIADNDEKVAKEEGIFQQQQQQLLPSLQTSSSNSTLQNRCDDNPLKTIYAGTDGDGRHSYTGYIRIPKVQRVRPLNMSQNHIILDTSDWHLFNTKKKTQNNSSPSSQRNCIKEDHIVNDNLLTISQQEEEQQQQQQQEIPLEMTVELPDKIDYDENTTCPICHSYLPFGPQCFPCIIMTDEQLN